MYADQDQETNERSSQECGDPFLQPLHDGGYTQFCLYMSLILICNGWAIYIELKVTVNLPYRLKWSRLQVDSQKECKGFNRPGLVEWRNIRNIRNISLLLLCCCCCCCAVVDVEVEADYWCLLRLHWRNGEPNGDLLSSNGRTLTETDFPLEVRISVEIRCDDSLSKAIADSRCLKGSQRDVLGLKIAVSNLFLLNIFMIIFWLFHWYIMCKWPPCRNKTNLQLSTDGYLWKVMVIFHLKWVMGGMTRDHKNAVLLAEALQSPIGWKLMKKVVFGPCLSASLILRIVRLSLTGTHPGV